METEFWGVEVKNGEPLKVSPGDGMVLHLSQASLGELKNEKGKESVSLFVNVDGKKLVLGTLITNKLPQHQFDLLFDRDFELSHNWKSGSVYFYGYKTATELPEGESDESESEEDFPLNLANNGKSESKAKQEKPADAERANIPNEKDSDAGRDLVKIVETPKESDAGRDSLKIVETPKESDAGRDSVKIVETHKESDAGRDSVKIVETHKESDAGRDSVNMVETHKDVNPQDDDESSYEDLMSEDDDEDDSQDSDDSDDKSDERDKGTPKKVETSKKRPVESIESAAKTPIPDKKAKVTPQKTDDNKTAPLPGKEAEKTPAEKPNKQTLISGSYPCKMCNRKFGSEQGVEAHTKAKHGGGM